MPYFRTRKSNKTGIKLVYLGDKICFQSEINLEDYMTKNFNTIFPDLILLKRQHSVKMQRCDLLCCDKNTQQPVIIELKNEEDRYIVSQLIRYRHAILTEQPFLEKINYSLPVKLIAIAPIFHEYNYIDKAACKFENDLYFWQFNINYIDNIAQFQICNNSYDIPYPILGLDDHAITETELTTDSLNDFVKNFMYYLPENYRDDFLKLRLLFISQPKVKEMVSSSYRKILYGTGDGLKSKKLAEITNTKTGLYLYLWLPTAATFESKSMIAKYGFICQENSNPLSQDSQVEWIVCTNDTINIKEKPENNNNQGSLTRQGMLKWCRGNKYIQRATIHSQYSSWTTEIFLIKLLKNIPSNVSCDDETIKWFESYITNHPDHLGWFVDLAIKTWNWNIK